MNEHSIQIENEKQKEGDEDNLNSLHVKCLASYPPVNAPFLTFQRNKPIAKQHLWRRIQFDFLKRPITVHQQLLDHISISYRKSGVCPKPIEEVFPIKRWPAGVMRHNPLSYIVWYALAGDGSGLRLRDQPPPHLGGVAEDRAVVWAPHALFVEVPFESERDPYDFVKEIAREENQRWK